jgi:hypothetical protein
VLPGKMVSRGWRRHCSTLQQHDAMLSGTLFPARAVPVARPGGDVVSIETCIEPTRAQVNSKRRPVSPVVFKPSGVSTARQSLLLARLLAKLLSFEATSVPILALNPSTPDIVTHHKVPLQTVPCDALGTAAWRLVRAPSHLHTYLLPICYCKGWHCWCLPLPDSVARLLRAFDAWLDALFAATAQHSTARTSERRPHHTCAVLAMRSAPHLNLTCPVRSLCGGQQVAAVGPAPGGGLPLPRHWECPQGVLRLPQYTSNDGDVGGMIPPPPAHTLSMPAGAAPCVPASCSCTRHCSALVAAAARVPCAAAAAPMLRSVANARNAAAAMPGGN